MNTKELQVAALRNGTVIDHIPSEHLFKVVSLLGLNFTKHQITIGNNFESKKMGTKGFIKIADKFFEGNEINKITLVAPQARLNIIKDYEIIEKQNLSLPERIRKVVKCNNPKCITNNEPMETIFDVIDKENTVLKCHYCEHKIQKNDIQIL
ncbi:MAG: aspartate carbamoyltransferase regulatory subunit [Paludibacteraceae bacterium]|nr:aspartate carbamoyltransferase regulatory subunit [Paludibacteraceae bacterium]